jgi:hypothetical protein
VRSRATHGATDHSTAELALLQDVLDEASANALICDWKLSLGTFPLSKFPCLEVVFCKDHGFVDFVIQANHGLVRVRCLQTFLALLFALLWRFHEERLQATLNRFFAMTKAVCATLSTGDAVTRIRVHVKVCRLVVRASRAVMLVVPTSSDPIGLKAGDAALVARFLTGLARLASIARPACTGGVATCTCAALAAFFVAIPTPEAITTTLVASAIAVTGAL